MAKRRAMTPEQKEARNAKLRVNRRTPGHYEHTKQKFSVRAVKCKNRARSMGLPCDITTRYLWDLWVAQEKKCALTGIPFVAWDEPLDAPQWNSWSVDRIDGPKGYTQGNVRLVLYCVNSMRGAAQGDEHLYTVARALLETQGKVALDA